MEGKSMEYPTQQPQVRPQVRPGTTTEVDLVEVFYLLWGHWWQILLSLIAGAALVFAGTYFLITPQYEASARIYIVSASDDSVVNLSDLQVGSSLTADYQELLLSRPLMEDVIQQLGLKELPGGQALPVEKLREMIQITNTPDTRILKITVTSLDPRQSADIANQLVEQACVYLPRIMGTEKPRLVEAAIPPESKSSPSYAKNSVLGGLLGAVLWAVALVLGHLMNDTFVTPEDVERYLGIQPLAAIPEGNLETRRRKSKHHAGRKGRRSP